MTGSSRGDSGDARKEEQVSETKRSHRKMDPDIKALAVACRALDGSSSQRMLRANLVFLWDRYVLHPTEHAKSLPAESW